MPTARKRPELVLPDVLVKCITKELGAPVVNALTGAQCAEIASICLYAATKVGEIVGGGEPKKKSRKLSLPHVNPDEALPPSTPAH